MGRLLTSLEGVLEGVGVEYLEPFLCAAREAALVLVKANVQNLFLGCHFKIFNIIIIINHS